MISRFWIGTSILAAVGTTLAGTALAQRAGNRLEMFRELRQRTEQLQDRLPADPNPTSIARPGDYRFSFQYDGVTREYLVHVPTSYRPGKPTPMLMALHGGGGDDVFQADDSKYKLISKSEQAGFIAVFPNGYSRFRNGMLATWNAGRCCGGAQKTNSDDVGFLREVIHRVERQASIDPRKVFVAGMSNGAMMSWRLACEAPEVRAIAPVEGTDNTTTCHPAHPVPVIEFHSLDDNHVPFNGGKGDLSVAQVDFTSVPASQSKWVAIDRADPAAKRVLTVPGAHCDLHAAKPGGAPVELCVTDTGGHSWAGGGTQQGRLQPSTAISANDLMWNFFSSL